MRFRVIEACAAGELLPFICDNVECGSTVFTDGWSGYKNLGDDEFLRVLKARRSCAGMPVGIFLQFTRVLEGRILSLYGVSVAKKSLDCGRADKVQDIGDQSDPFIHVLLQEHCWAKAKREIRRSRLLSC